MVKKIETVGIIGFNVMGAAISLNAATCGYHVVFKELNDDLVQAMYKRWVTDALAKRVEKGKMSQEDMDAVAGRIKGTSNYEDLANCDLIIEAAVEKMDLKIQIFKDLSEVVRSDTIMVSNTSTILIETVMSQVKGQERTAGLHYFFPANVNRLVEVIRQKSTSDATYEALMEFSQKNKKVAISVKDFPGFAINPIFISSYVALIAMNDKMNVATMDQVSKDALGIKFGIMWVVNGGGIATCYHGAASMNDYLAATDVGFPAVPAILKKHYDNKLQPFNLEDGPISQDAALMKAAQEELLGTIFAIAAHLIDKGVVSIADLELGCKTALAWPKGPFTLMNEMGMAETARLIKAVVDKGHFKMPKSFVGAVPAAWKL